MDEIPALPYGQTEVKDASKSSTRTHKTFLSLDLPELLYVSI
jgi:hypothetical protein